MLRLLRKFARLDGAIDSRVVLVNHAARTNIQMADFGVAHLAARQTDRTFRSIDGRVREFVPQPIPVGFGRAADGVVVRRIATADAVEYQEDDGRNDCRVGISRALVSEAE